MEDSIEFFISENGVILSKGNNGIIDKKYFKSVKTRDGAILIW